MSGVVPVTRLFMRRGSTKGGRAENHIDFSSVLLASLGPGASVELSVSVPLGSRLSKIVSLLPFIHFFETYLPELLHVHLSNSRLLVDDKLG